MELNCPKCSGPIPLDDINVATDIALCRACGATHSFAELRLNAVQPPLDLRQPPKGAWFRTTPRGFVVGATTRTWGALFVVPFTLVWSGGSLGGIYGSQIVKGQFDWTQSLFGIPFLIGSCLLVPTALMTCAGKVEVRVEGSRGTIFTGVGSLGWRRRFRWDEVSEVKFGEASWRQNYRAVRQIFLVAERTLKFGSGIAEVRQDFLCAALKRLKGTVAS